MDNQPKNDSGKTLSSTYTPGVTAPTPPTPKVFDLSKINAVNSGGNGGFFNKKSFIIGILSVILLVLVGAGVVYYAIPKPTAPTPKAAGTFVNISCTGTAGDSFPYTGVRYKFANKEDCVAARCNGSTGNYYACVSGCYGTGTCSTLAGSCNIAVGQTSCSISRPVGACEAVQLDISNSACSGSDIAVDCSSCATTVLPSPTPVPSPTPSPTATPQVTPTPPTTPIPTPTPTPPAACNSSCLSNFGCPAGLVCSGGFCRNPSCTIQADCSCVTPTPGVTPTPIATPTPVATPTPGAQTHKECQNNACVDVAGSGTNQCSSDVSCQPAAVPPPIPKSGNTSLTVLGGVLGLGALLGAVLLGL